MCYWNGKKSDSAILLNQDDNISSQGYAQIKEAIRALTKDIILQPFISGHGFRISNITADDVG